jgi:hypothetical protein
MREGAQHLNLTKGERQELARNLVIERVVSMFLDLEEDRTWKQIAEEVGLSYPQLKRLTQSPEFRKVYDEATVSIGHDPRLQAITTALPNLLPLAFRKIRTILTNPGTRDDVALKAALEVMKINKIGDQLVADDPRDLQNFLKANNVKLEGDIVVNVGIPEEFRKAFQKFTGTDIVDAIARDVEDRIPDSRQQTSSEAAPEVLEPEPVEQSAEHSEGQ